MNTEKYKYKYPGFSKCMIYQIGAGGIGAYLAPMICRVMLNDNSRIAKYMIVDNDSVEPKNMFRQNFAVQDLGKNKAYVLASRYSGIFGVPIYFNTERLSSENFNSIFNISSYMYSEARPVIVSCVDNHETRWIVERELFTGTRWDSEVAWVDIANDITNGQVFISRGSVKMSDVHPEISEPQSGSCAEDTRQLFNTNAMSAIIGFNVIWDLMTNGHNYYEVVFSINNAIKKYYYNEKGGVNNGSQGQK